MVYDNLTDDELLRFAAAPKGAVDPTLLTALAERLEMRLRDIAELEHALGRTAPDRPATHPDADQGSLF